MRTSLSALTWKNVMNIKLIFIKLIWMMREEIENGSSGAPQWMFITWIIFKLYLLRRRSWVYQYQTILCYIQSKVKMIQLNYLQFYVTNGRWGHCRHHVGYLCTCGALFSFFHSQIHWWKISAFLKFWFDCCLFVSL